MIYVLILLVVILFGSSFLSKKRFGLLGLSLIAGSYLSDIWGYDIGLMASAFGLPSEPPYSTAVLVLVILLPAMLLMLQGPSYKTLIGRTIGSSLFTILALALLVNSFGSQLILQDYALTATNWLRDNRVMIIGLCAIVSIIDIFITKPIKPVDKRRKH